jgi:hypothetical protein
MYAGDPDHHQMAMCRPMPHHHDPQEPQQQQLQERLTCAAAVAGRCCCPKPSLKLPGGREMPGASCRWH